ncbi:MAG TPA: CDP-alcohol phosphatidyltransferase family protein [Membranihabitans sp.]|nr:CDP-alcohol phosphatidyltransferase family protein [Membranihabitans sp.]
MKKYSIKGENIINVPNVLSMYRLLVSPVILYFALTYNEKWFVILICISLVTDILDGNIARIYKLQTNFGAALDNLADMFTFAMALLGLVLFRWTEIQPHAWLLYLFLGIFVLSYIVGFSRFGKIPGLHLYGAVIAGYLQGLFFFVLFLYGFYPWLYYLAVGWGILAYIEKIIVLWRLDDIRIGVKGLYWMMKEDAEESVH